MKPIWEAYLCHIEITNLCPMACSYCDRYIRHVRKDQRFFMSIEEIERAIDSLEGWFGDVGIMGGEPTIHPQFAEICQLIKRRGLKDRFRLFTMGGQAYQNHLQLIKEAFHVLNINPHNDYQKTICLNQPITVAAQDIVEDDTYRNELIDNCIIQETWCPSIGPKGAFFCEVAYALDTILDGEGGYPVEPGWWRKTPDKFRDQIDRYCKYCGFPVPLERELIRVEKEKFSPGLLALFKKHRLPRLSDEDVILFDRKLTIEEMEKTKPTWDPYNYRQDRRPDMRDGWKNRRHSFGGRFRKNTPLKCKGEGSPR